MTNYRIFNAKEYTAGQSGSLERAWGVMRGSAICSGSITLEGVVDNKKFLENQSKSLTNMGEKELSKTLSTIKNKTTSSDIL